MYHKNVYSCKGHLLTRKHIFSDKKTYMLYKHVRYTDICYFTVKQWKYDQRHHREVTSTEATQHFFYLITTSLTQDQNRIGVCHFLDQSQKGSL